MELGDQQGVFGFGGTCDLCPGFQESDDLCLLGADLDVLYFLHISTLLSFILQSLVASRRNISF